VAANTKTPKGERGRADNVEMMERVRRIVTLASGSDQPTREELANEFGITTRAVANVISYMKEIGIEISSQNRPRDGKKGYVVMAADFLRQDMSVAEAVASVLLTRSALGTPLAADRDSAESGVHRITSSLGKGVKQKLEQLEGRFAVRLLRAAKPPRADTFRVVLDCLLENRVVNMEYESPYAAKKGPAAAESAVGAATSTSASPKARKIETVLVEPYGVFFARRSWYLVARKRPSGGMRLYKLARIKRLEATSQLFEMPRGWTIDRYLEHAWEIITRDAPPVKVVVDLSKDVAGNMLETQWHPSQQVTMRPDGSARFTARVSGFDEIVWWILSIGSNARVVEPKELRDRVHEEIRRMHRMVEQEA
jgi:predicted DNA-binding transcriptional regulator YafY